MLAPPPQFLLPSILASTSTSPSTLSPSSFSSSSLSVDTLVSSQPMQSYHPWPLLSLIFWFHYKWREGRIKLSFSLVGRKQIKKQQFFSEMVMMLLMLMERIWEIAMFTGSCQTQSFPNAHSVYQPTIVPPTVSTPPFRWSHWASAMFVPRYSLQSIVTPDQAGCSYFAH